MTRSFGTVVAVVALAGAVSAMYGRRLADMPMFLSPDEVIIAVDSHSLASTGHDVEGRFLPLYFNIQMQGESRRGWFTPIIFYASALFQKVLPFSETVVRLPTVCVGILDVVLMFLVAMRLFRNRPYALFAAALLAMTPAHFLMSRLGMDYLYPLPFILAWLLCLVAFVETERPGVLLAGAACLGTGLYSYIGAMVMMPVYLALTLLVAVQKRMPARFFLAAAVGFCMPLLPLSIWLLGHPTAFADTLQRYELYDARSLSFAQGLRSYFSYLNIDRLASMYWNFFNPSFLFITGGLPMMFSTRTAGMFLLAVAILLLLGIVATVRRWTEPMSQVMLLGFVTAPVAALLGGEQGASQRVVEMFPFVVLLATYGVEYLWSARLVTRYRPKGIRLEVIATVGLVAVMLLQFGRFYAGYFGEYRERSAPWFGGNVRGALEALIEEDARTHPPSIHFATLRASSGVLDIRNRWIDVYWKFYLIKHRREDLLARTMRYEPRDGQHVPSGGLVLGNLGDVAIDALVKSGELKLVRNVAEPDNSVFFEILRR